MAVLQQNRTLAGVVRDLVPLGKIQEKRMAARRKDFRHKAFSWSKKPFVQKTVGGWGTRGVAYSTAGYAFAITKWDQPSSS